MCKAAVCVCVCVCVCARTLLDLLGEIHVNHTHDYYPLSELANTTGLYVCVLYTSIVMGVYVAVHNKNDISVRGNRTTVSFTI